MNFKKIRKAIAALSLTVMLGVASSSIVHALPVPGPNEPLMISKTLTVPEGVKTPDETFTFTFERHSYNGKKIDALQPEELKKFPEINDATVSFSSTDEITRDADSNTPGRQIREMSENVVPGPGSHIPGFVTYSEVGQYSYIVRESKGTNAKITYDEQAYLLSIFVEPHKKIGNPVATSFYIAPYSKDAAGNETIGEKIEYDPNKGLFENFYDKKVENVTEENAAQESFILKKVVTDNQPNANNKYKFTLTVNKPAGSKSEDTTFEYVTTSGREATGTYGKPFEVELKHNETIYFQSVLLGSTVKVEETDSLGYIESIGTGSLINGQSVTLDALKAGVIIGDNGNNSVIYENAQQTPTGVLLDNLPFIVLAALAGGGIFFFVKSRKHEGELGI